MSKQMTLKQPKEHTQEGSKGARKCTKQEVLVKTASWAPAPEILIQQVWVWPKKL